MNILVIMAHPDDPEFFCGATIARWISAGNPLYFVDLWREEGFAPHSVQDVWVSLTATPNLLLDVTDYWNLKIQALKQHTSQIGNLR